MTSMSVECGWTSILEQRGKAFVLMSYINFITEFNRALGASDPDADGRFIVTVRQASFPFSTDILADFIGIAHLWTA